MFFNYLQRSSKPNAILVVFLPQSDVYQEYNQTFHLFTPRSLYYYTGENQRYLHSAYIARGDPAHLHTLTARQALRYACYLRRGDHGSVSSAEVVRHDWTYGHR